MSRDPRARRRRAVAVWALAGLLALLFPVTAPNADPGVLTGEQRQALLADHNARRARLARGEVAGQPGASNMNELFWDAGLEAVAQSWARRCEWRHNPDPLRDLDADQTRFRFDVERAGVGENMYAMTGSDTGVSALVQGHEKWWGEHRGYGFERSSCSGVCGHYTQMAWAKTRYVGCAYAICPELSGQSGEHVLYVCNYFPAGNVVGRKAYTTGKACSNCDSDRGSCEGGLCSGCMAPRFAQCSDHASNCAELAGSCPARCTPDSDAALCQACRASCGTCPQDWLEPEASCRAVP